jgi:hypothetical protein
MKRDFGVDFDECQIGLVVAGNVVGVVGFAVVFVVTLIFKSAARSTTCWLVTM